MKNLGWLGKIDEVRTDKESIIRQMEENLKSIGFSVEDELIVVWRDCLDFLASNFPEKYRETYLCLEYVLPRMDNRRPDVIVFLENKIMILEFKMKDIPKKNDIVQAVHYKEDILRNHKETWEQGYEVESYLVLTKAKKPYYDVYGVKILTEGDFFSFFEKLNLNSMPLEKIENWLNSIFESQPKLTQEETPIFKPEEFLEKLDFKEAFLNLDLEELKRNVKLLYSKGYELYWTDDMKIIEEYLKSKKLETNCILGVSGGKPFVYKKSSDHWYKGKIENAVEDFDFQELDVDYPVLVFSGEYYLFHNNWDLAIGKGVEHNRKTFEEVNKHMQELYSVLLTIGKKGMLLFLPGNVEELEELRNFIKDSGIKKLEKTYF